MGMTGGLGGQVIGSQAQVAALSLALPLRRADLEALGLRGLHCGCGRTLHRGFLNSDVMGLQDAQGNRTLPGQLYRIPEELYYLQHDQTAPLPLEAESVDWVFSEHFIEHISFEQAVAWLREVYRVLKPGGMARISTPDLALYVSGYADPEQTFYRRHCQQLQAMGMHNCPSRPAWMLNQIFRFHEHQWIYDLEELMMAVGSAGFDPALVQRRSYRQGAVPEMACLDQEIRSDESLYVEIQKPPLQPAVAMPADVSRIARASTIPDPLPFTVSGEALVLRGLKPLQKRVPPESVSLFAIIGDEPYFLPHFLRHYRQLGIAAFALYLDRPSPQTLQLLEAQDDVELLTSDLPYGTSFGQHSSGVMIRLHHLLQDQFTEQGFAGRWLLTVDADEFVILPSGYASIGEFCRMLDLRHLVHVSAPMVDFYPSRLSLRHFDPSLSPFEGCPWFDQGPYYQWQEPQLVPRPLHGGVRERITNELARNHPQEWQQLLSPNYLYQPPKLWKVPLIKHGCGVQRILMHEATQTPSSDISLALAHFKYHPGVDAKVAQAISRAEHYRGALEYRIMDLAFRRLAELDLSQSPRSRYWQGPASLEHAGLLCDG